MHTKKNSNNKAGPRTQAERVIGSDPEDDLLNIYKLGLEDEAWRKIVKALAARGYPVKDDDLQSGRW